MEILEESRSHEGHRFIMGQDIRYINHVRLVPTDLDTLYPWPLVNRVAALNIDSSPNNPHILSTVIRISDLKRIETVQMDRSSIFSIAWGPIPSLA